MLQGLKRTCEEFELKINIKKAREKEMVNILLGGGDIEQISGSTTIWAPSKTTDKMFCMERMEHECYLLVQMFDSTSDFEICSAFLMTFGEIGIVLKAPPVG